MPSYKFSYFNARGFGEVPRLIMAYGGIEYEDIRLERPQWEEWQPKTPYGVMPILEVDGEMICQSKAISRYLAQQTGLMGSSALEDAKIYMVVECITDSMKPLFAYIFEEDKERQKVLGEKYRPTFPAEMKKLENLIPADSKHFVGNKMSWADIEASYYLTIPGMVEFDINWEDVPRLKALKDNVDSHPKIAEWIAKRPQTLR